MQETEKETSNKNSLLWSNKKFYSMKYKKFLKLKTRRGAGVRNNTRRIRKSIIYFTHAVFNPKGLC